MSEGGNRNKADRYTRLFTLPSDLYTAGSPLVIAAGALLKDTQTGRVLAQLKLSSISDQRIRAVKLRVIGYDVSQAVLCEEEHQYLDLDVKRDTLFGAKEAILLPSSAVRSFTAELLAVYFTDGTSYLYEDSRWESLPAQEDLTVRLFDAELIRQYRLETSEKSRYVPLGTRDLWLCSCGRSTIPSSAATAAAWIWTVSTAFWTSTSCARARTSVFSTRRRRPRGGTSSATASPTGSSAPGSS